jgi:hypothetical protein
MQHAAFEAKCNRMFQLARRLPWDPAQGGKPR